MASKKYEKIAECPDKTRCIAWHALALRKNPSRLGNQFSPSIAIERMLQVCIRAAPVTFYPGEAFDRSILQMHFFTFQIADSDSSKTRPDTRPTDADTV